VPEITKYIRTNWPNRIAQPSREKPEATRQKKNGTRLKKADISKQGKIRQDIQYGDYNGRQARRAINGRSTVSKELD
jgi:hypothetical protein